MVSERGIKLIKQEIAIARHWIKQARVFRNGKRLEYLGIAQMCLERAEWLIRGGPSCEGSEHPYFAGEGIDKVRT